MEATVLAQEFQRRFKTKYNYYPYSMKTVKDGKWWEHFTSFCYKSELEDGREHEFVDKLFSSWESEEKLFPFVLSQKLAQDVELSLTNKVETQEISETDYINLTLKKVSIWAKQNRVYNNKLGAFLSDSTCIARALRGEFYKPLFMFCSDFLNRYGEPTEEDILKKNSIRAFHPELYETLKVALNVKFRD